MKFSRQRELIKGVLTKRLDHPTAEDIYQEIHEIEPTISLATVYRNLNLLADNREIRRVRFQGASDRFDPITTEHFHFVCNKCGKVKDLDIKTEFKSMDEIIMNDTGADVYFHDLIVYGECKECLQES